MSTEISIGLNPTPANPSPYVPPIRSPFGMLQTIPAEAPSSVPGASIPAPNPRDPPLNEKILRLTSLPFQAYVEGEQKKVHWAKFLNT